MRDKHVTPLVWLCSLLVSATISAGMTYLACIWQQEADWHKWQKEQQKSCLRPQNNLLTLSSLKGCMLCKTCKYANRQNFARRKRVREELKTPPHLNIMQTPDMQPEISGLFKNK